MTFCSNGEKAIVKYSFKNGQTKTYETVGSILGIAVNQLEVPESSFEGIGYCNAVIYQVSFNLIIRRSAGFPTTNQRYTARVYGSVLQVLGFTYDPTQSVVPSYQILCRGQVTYSPGTTTPNVLPTTTIKWYVQGIGAGGRNYLQTEVVQDSISIVRVDNLPDNCQKPPYPLCEITITNRDRTRFVDSGECPCIYTVQCGDCPAGTLRCDCPSDPRGYCCLPCNETITSINTITNLLKAFNSG